MNFEIVIGLLSKVTVWLLLVWGATYMLRHKTAALRHLLWATGLTGALLLPVLELVPGWQVLPWPATAAKATVAAAPVGAPRPVTPSSEVGTKPQPEVYRVETESAGKAAVQPAVATSRAPAVEVGPPAATAADRLTAPVAAPPIPWGTVLLGVWGLGAAFLLLRLVHGFHTVRRIARRAQTVAGGREREALDQALETLDVRRRVQLRRGGGVAGPMTWGLVRPVVVLPDGAEQWTASRLHAVLHHEVAHVARRDCLVQLVARLVRCVYWFHPFAWIANRGLHLEQERACDDVVLRAGVPASAYAEDLMCIAKNLRPMPSVALVSTAIARPSELMGRMQYLLDGGQARRRTPPVLRLTMVGGAMLLSAALGVARPITDAPVEAQDKQDKEHPLAARLVGLLDLKSHRAQAIRELVAIGAPALPSIKRALHDERAAVALAAVAVLSQMAAKDAAAAPVLIAALDHAQAEVRRAAAVAIGKFGPEARSALARLQQTKGESAQLSRALAAALAPRTAPLKTKPAKTKPSKTKRVPKIVKPRNLSGLMLIADYSENRIFELDAQGRVVFSIDEIFGVWDVESLDNGNLLITEFSVNRVSEVTRKNKVVWSFEDLKNPYDADRLANGNTLIADTFGGRVIEVDKAGKVVWKYAKAIRPYDVERLPNGDTLIADAVGKRVIEVDRAGRVTWEVKNLPNVHDVDRLPNGNTLVTVRTRNEVIEIDRSGKVVWRLKGLRSPSDADRLPNGTTVVAENGAVRIFSSNGREVWCKPVTWAVEVNMSTVRRPAAAATIEKQVESILKRVQDGDRHAASGLLGMRERAFPILVERLPRVTSGRVFSATMQTLLKDRTSAEAVVITKKLLARMRGLPAKDRQSTVRYLTACMSAHREPLDFVLRACEKDFPGREVCYRALPRIARHWDHAADVLIARLRSAGNDDARQLVEVLGSRAKPTQKVVDALVAAAVGHRSERVALAALTSLMNRGIYRRDIAKQLNRVTGRKTPALVAAQRRYLDEILFDAATYVPPTLLVADYSDNRIAEYDAKGKEVFALERVFGVWDVEPLDNGNLLLTEFSISKVTEITRDRKVVWSFAKLKNPYDADRLANGNTLIADTFGRRVIEVDKAGKIVWQYDEKIHPYDVDRLANGNTLIADTHLDRVIEVDRAGKIVWQIENVSIVHDADRLANGNTLLTIRMLNEVREVDAAGNTVMRLQNLSSPSDADRLADGSTVVAENGFVRVFSPGGRELYRKVITWAVEVNVR